MHQDGVLGNWGIGAMAFPATQLPNTPLPPPNQGGQVQPASAPAASADIPFPVEITNDLRRMSIYVADQVLDVEVEGIFASEDVRAVISTSRADEEVVPLAALLTPA